MKGKRIAVGLGVAIAIMTVLAIVYYSTSNNQSSSPPASTKLSVSVTPLMLTISRGSYQSVSVQVVDEQGKPIEGASISTTVTYASGLQKTFSGQSDSSGNWNFSWQIGGNSNTGTYDVNAIASKSGYKDSSGSATFSVTTAS